MAMTNPHHQRRQWYWYGLQLEMTHFMWLYRHATITKNLLQYWNARTKPPTKVAPHSSCHSNRSCVHQQYRKSMFLLLLTTSDHQWCWYMASINPFLLFAGVHSVRNVTVATSTSLPSPRRSYRGNCHPGQLYHVHILCSLGLYKTN